jgi:hypothetical protein
MEEQMVAQKKPINCFLCRYFYTTWDPGAPYGCRLFGFKTKESPAKMVAISSGDLCNGFQEKKKKNQIDSLDSDLKEFSEFP